MQEIPLHFTGPLSFMPGHRYLFDSPLRGASCIYLWTFRSDIDGRHLIHYVGEAKVFAKRQREHLVHVLGLNYGLFDPADACRGTSTVVWPGLWRLKSAAGPAELLERYDSLSGLVLDYLNALSVFVAPLDDDQRLRRQVEGSIARSLRSNHPEAAVLYPADNRTMVGKNPVGVRVLVTSDEPIAGLESILEV